MKNLEVYEIKDPHLKEAVLDISYKYDVIINSNLNFVDNNENIYVIPQQELKEQALKIISEPVIRMEVNLI